jgi:hypothetical protein
VRLLVTALGGHLEALNLSYTAAGDGALPLLAGMKVRVDGRRLRFSV